jgi:hypothetical protein
MAMQQSDYEAVLEVMRSGRKWQAETDRLRNLMVSTGDRELRIYLGDVLQLVASPYVKTMGVSHTMPLPLYMPPFKTLVEYCQHQIKLSGRSL